jgi:serine phosphatase RsbU (regulator of sigma subunit)
MILVYTDGIIEAKNMNQAFYGARRLEKVVEACPADPILLVQKNVDSVDEFSRERNQSDDLTLVCFKREASGPPSL